MPSALVGLQASSALLQDWPKMPFSTNRPLLSSPCTHSLFAPLPPSTRLALFATPAKAKMLEKNRYLVFSTRQSYLGSVSFSGPRVDDQQPRFGRRPLCWYCDDHLKVYSLPTDLSSPASPHISPALTDTLQPCRHVSKSPKMVFPPTGANPVGCSKSSSPSLPLPISFSSVMIRVL